ncbi:MAG TPA: CocE/NonD family hydrolase [Solirubrobacteraceae bacterium]|nr:CocE/NonD family hydrolase [Solirubrobacteraceae bacterium]
MVKRAAAVASLAAALPLALAAPAAAAPRPFGLTCTAQHGVRFCPNGGLSQRVATFDGVPLDVDVTLPARGNGPFPTLVMLHGFGGEKNDFEAINDTGTQLPNHPQAQLYHWNNTFYAHRGYLVLNYSARGFGNSCGHPASRTPGSCDRGWTRVFDQRFEVRDTQVLLGRLVDAGLAKPGALGVTGISSGGIQSLELAFLRNQIRTPSGGFAPWRSPRGRALSMTSAFPRWMGSDLTDALLPNGRQLDFRVPAPSSLSPIGVENKSFVTGLSALGQANGYVAPKGADAGADLIGWQEIVGKGEPYGAAVRAIGNQLIDFHGVSRMLARNPTPLLMQDGWTDDLFSPGQALRVYNALRSRRPGAAANVALQFGDLGHARGSASNARLNQQVYFNDQAFRFFERWLRGRGSGLAPGSVATFTQTCPVTRNAGGPFTASSWTAIHPGAVRFGGSGARTVTSTGGNPATAVGFNPNFGTSNSCTAVPRENAAGTAVYQRATTRAYTVIGRPIVRARIRTTGPFGQLQARLWNVAPNGMQTLVGRGAYRLTPNQTGTLLFQLRGTGWRFERGHTAKLELLGNDDPYERASNGTFSVVVSGLTVELPARERPGTVPGVFRPLLAPPLAPFATRRSGTTVGRG